MRSVLEGRERGATAAGVMRGCWHLWRRKVVSSGLCTWCLLDRCARDTAKQRHPAGKGRA